MTWYGRTRHAVELTPEEAEARGKAAEVLARHKKASALVAAFREAGITPDQLEGADDAFWFAAAQKTGTRIASEATRALTLVLLRERDASVSL